MSVIYAGDIYFFQSRDDFMDYYRVDQNGRGCIGWCKHIKGSDMPKKFPAAFKCSEWVDGTYGWIEMDFDDAFLEAEKRLLEEIERCNDSLTGLRILKLANDMDKDEV